MNNDIVKNELIEIGKIPSGWKMVKLHELGENHDSVVAGPFGSNLKVSDYRDEGVPIIRLQNIERNRFLDKDIKYIGEEKAKELQYHSFKAGDLLLAKLGDPIGKTCLVPQNMRNGIVVADVVRARISSEKAVTQFIEFVLNCDYCTKQLNKQTIGTTRPRVNLTDVRELMIALPPPAEQQKITSILSKVDNLIQKTDEIIGQTQRLKKGLMRHLLTKGIGHSKFKEVSSYFGKQELIPEAWGLKPLSKIGDIVGGGTPDTTNKDYWNGEIHWAVPTDITHIDSNFITNTERKITDKGLRDSAAILLPVGSVLITSRATVGECAINTVPMATNQGFQSLICNASNYNLFMLYAIRFHKKRLLSIAYGTTFLEVPKSEMKKIRIPCPPLEEQKEIANILLTLDELIEEEVRNKTNLNKLKKGLMQKLLTGNIRVKV
jgi:type I restriction enzyme S subunit